MLVSDTQQSDPVIHIQMNIYLCRLLEDTEYSSLYYAVDPYGLSILYIVVCIC